jgi:ParB/RepB/Spo0J family partition protein
MASSKVVAEVKVPASKIHANPKNPRLEAGDISELVESIKMFGLLQSVIVRKAPQFGPDHFELLGGQRRWTACRFIDSEYVLDCRVLSVPIDTPPELLTIIVAMHENSQKPLTPMERARAYGKMRDEFGLTQHQIADRLGVKTWTVSRYLSLMDLAPQAQKRVEDGKLKVDDAIAAVKKHRAKERDKKGHAPVDVGWEPDFFSDKWFLARRAINTCRAREHNSRRLLWPNGACGACCDTVIRQDEAKVQATSLRDQGFDVPFQSPEMAAVGNQLGNPNNGKE